MAGLEAVRLSDGSYRLSDGTIVKPATENQLKAEQLVETVFNDPALGAPVHEFATKMFGQIKPHANTVIKKTVVEPEVAAIRKQLETTEEKLAKALERIDERDKREEEAKTVSDMRASIADARRKYGLTDEGEQKLIERMREMKNYTDVEAAAAYVVHSAPPQPTSGPSWAPHKTDFYGTAKANEAFADLHKDPMGFMDGEIAKFLKDPAQYASE